MKRAALMKSNNEQVLEEGLSEALNKIQIALDIAGLEPTIGILADGSNAIISTLRAVASKEKNTRKKHLINAGISALSVIPFGDVLKILKLRKVSKPATKLAIKGIKAGKVTAKGYKDYTSDHEHGKKFDSEYKRYLEKFNHENI